MKILYFDCPAGISGDMVLGAMLDLGALDLDSLVAELKKLPLSGYTVKVAKEQRMGITGTRVTVELNEIDKERRSFKDIRALISDSDLSEEVKSLALSIFTTLAVAEAKVHGVDLDDVHFHEVGATDSIVDIVGAAILFTALKPGKVLVSTLALGGGMVETRHGPMPVPAPATLEIIKGLSTLAAAVEAELTTPTGAAIIKTLSTGVSVPMPRMKIKGAGYGVGSRDFKEVPNLLRVIVGECEGEGKTPSPSSGKVVVIETNIDDMNPELSGYLIEKLMGEGALDAYFTPVQMKKSRPGTLLTVLSNEAEKDGLIDTIFRESTAIGVRFYPAARRVLERKIVKVSTCYGEFSVKVSMLQGKPVSFKPEFEELKKVAESEGIVLKELFDEVRAVFLSNIRS
ncbi:MAG: nickel pincer cofactor biosynthesis protein LarC [Thermodesulfobacteriota bacterium]